jgi:methionine-rich copper-binding protein CopC
MLKPHRRRLLRQTLITLSLAAAALLAPISAASAHDILTGTNPQAGETVEEMPDALELTFSNNPLALGSVVAVQDTDGQNWAVGEVNIVDKTVTQAISPDAPAGDYTVTWRVVSSDSHPIEGTFEFTATAGGDGQAPEPVESAADGTNDAEATAADQAFPIGPIVLVAAAILVVVAAIAVVVRRKLAGKRSS